MADSDEKKKTAPYISFTTFLSALDAVAAAGVPNIIDRHSFPSFSGGAVAQVLSAFRFFGLINDAGEPDERLHTLAKDKDHRPAHIRQEFERHFDTILALDLTRATPGQLDQAFSDSKYNVSGATKRKSQAFFLKGATFAEIPVGKLLLSKSRNVSAPRKPRKPKQGQGGGTGSGTGITPPPDEALTAGTKKTIQLTNGGTLTLSLNVNILELRGKDRQFVFHLIDKIEEYETGSPDDGNYTASAGEVMP